MAKVVIELDLANEEDAELYERYMKSQRMYSAIWHITQDTLRPRWKHGVAEGQTAEELIEEIWKEVWETLSDYEIAGDF